MGNSAMFGCNRNCNMEYKAGAILVFLFYLALSKGEGNREQIVVKSIKSKDGDIFDCIDIMSQPTFQDPMFKNHIIQMKPSAFPVSMKEHESANETSLQSEPTAVLCPSGTIPIWRNQRKNISSFYIKEKLEHILMPDKSLNKGNDNRVLHMASIGTFKPNLGASAHLNVYKPDVKVGREERLSGSSTYINGGLTVQDQDYIEAGWFVRPAIAGDNEVRFHIFWYDGNRRKECINLACSGFIQVAKDIALGSKLGPVSIYEGPQRQITINIFQDFKTGNWWLAWGQEKKPIGYWEKSIFKFLHEGASRASWGGMVVYPRGEESPSMGSGHFPFEGFGRAAFVKDTKYVNDDHNLVSPYQDECYKIIDVPKCYDASEPETVVAGFYFGGPASCKS